MLALQTGLPVPDVAAYGVGGASVLLLIGILTWLIKSGVRTEKQVQRELAEKDKVIESEREARKEWRDTAIAAESGRAEALSIAKSATEQNKLLDYFFTTVMPKRADGDDE